MAHNKEQANNQQQQNRKANNVNSSNGTFKKGTPMIVERVNRYPLVNFAVSIGFSQYDKLKSSNVTVGDVMSRAESWAVYVWQKVQPIVEKLQDPINKADQLACHTLDFVEDKLQTMKIPQSVDRIVTKYKSSSITSGANNAN